MGRPENQATSARSRLGIASFSFAFRLSQPGGAAFREPLAFLEHCRRLGAGGVQIALGTLSSEAAALLRRKAEEAGMFIQGEARLPREPKDAERFEAEMRSAREAGASVVRLATGDRRYEQFTAEGQFREHAARTEESLRLAAPLAERHGIRLAVENHKDFRVPELLAALRRISSEHVGVCVDTGNSIALLEEPKAVVEAYAPFAHAVHLKDALLAPCEEGFLLADVPLGEGVLDLQGMVRTLYEKRPGLQVSLEMSTRDPLKVPCWTDRYWAVLPDVPARDLASILRLIREGRSKGPLPRVGDLPPERRMALEEANNVRSLAYARERLEL